MPRLVKLLQDGYDDTGAPIANLELQTVQNDHWGIAGGKVVNLTVIYLAQWSAFDEVLPNDTKLSIKNGSIACNLAIQNGMGKCGNIFPYHMASFFVSTLQVNLLSQMFSHMVMTNRELFSNVFALL